MEVKQQIELALTEKLTPSTLEVVNESDQHSVPANSETHFKVTVVSREFEEKRRVARHQMVYGLLREQLENGVHALALHTYTESEWSARGAAPDSPDCLGGSKREEKV